MQTQFNALRTAISPLCAIPAGDRASYPAAAAQTILNTIVLLDGMVERLHGDISESDYLLLTCAIAALRHADYCLEHDSHAGDFCRSLACGESWAVRLASIVDGHERTDDLADDIDHVMAENPDCFSPEQIAAAFQMQRREATR